MNSIVAELSRAVSDCGCGPLFVHADLLRARNFVPAATNRAAMLSAHAQVLASVANGRPVWTPCFNYEFTRSGQTDLRTAPCQVGPFGEHYRTLPESWRNTDPVFSACGVGEWPGVGMANGRYLAFGDASIFAELYRRDATVVFYGAPFASATAIHFAEQQAGGPVYRYDKVFAGEVISTCGNSFQIQYVYHVRPWRTTLEYDWPRLETALRDESLLREVRVGRRIVARTIGVRPLVDFWGDQLSHDPLCLLNHESRDWVEKRLNTLGRRFEQRDFETAPERRRAS